MNDKRSAQPQGGRDVRGERPTCDLRGGLRKFVQPETQRVLQSLQQCIFRESPRPPHDVRVHRLVDRVDLEQALLSRDEELVAVPIPRLNFEYHYEAVYKIPRLLFVYTTLLEPCESFMCMLL